MRPARLAQGFVAQGFVAQGFVACALSACAVPAAKPAVEAQPTLPSLTRLGDDMRHGGDSAGALDLYRAADARDPRDAEALARTGDAFLEVGEPGRAETAFRAALAVRDVPGAGRGLAVALLQQGRAVEALPLLQPLATDGAPAGVWRATGTALDLLGRQSEAQVAYRKGLIAAPADSGLHGNLALSLAISGQLTEALSEANAAVTAPNADPRQTANQVLLLAYAGQTEAARTRGRAMLGLPATNVLLTRAAQARATAPAARAQVFGLMAHASPPTAAMPAAAIPRAAIPLAAPSQVPRAAALDEGG